MSRKNDDPPLQPALVEREAGAYRFTGKHTLARRTLARDYAIVFFDRLPVTLRQADGADTLHLWFAVGVMEDGGKDVLGLWPPGSAGLDWRGVTSDLIYRGVAGVRIAVTPPNAAARAAIAAAFPPVVVLARAESPSAIHEDTLSGFYPIALSICAVLGADIAGSLSDRLGACGVRLPISFADGETALVTMSYLMALAAIDWRVAPEQWRVARDALAAAGAWVEARLPAPPAALS